MITVLPDLIDGTELKEVAGETIATRCFLIYNLPLDASALAIAVTHPQLPKVDDLFPGAPHLICREVSVVPDCDTLGMIKLKCTYKGPARK